MGADDMLFLTSVRDHSRGKGRAVSLPNYLPKSPQYCLELLEETVPTGSRGVNGSGDLKEIDMPLNVAKEVAVMQRLTIKELRARYAAAFGEETASNNKAWLIKRIAWRLQVLAEGDLSQRARQRAAELANDADLRLLPPKLSAATRASSVTSPAAVATSSTPVAATATPRIQGDGRLPLPGTVLTRAYKGQSLQVKVLPHGFEFRDKVYQSLSAVAKAITGQHCSGIYFFRLRKETAP
jgi:hypothetical protein